VGVFMGFDIGLSDKIPMLCRKLALASGRYTRAFDKQGLIIKKHPNGTKKSSCSYVAGKIDGVCKEWDEYGNVIFVGRYKAGVVLKFVRYKDKGTRKVEAFDRIERCFRYWNKFSSTSSDTASFSLDVTSLRDKYEFPGLKEMTITSQFYDIWGETRFSCYLSDDALGQKFSEVQFNNGKPHGSYQVWHENGTIKIEGQYVNGSKSGLFSKYFKDGTLNVSVNYRDDKKHGKLKHYNRKSRLILCAPYRNGKKCGTQKEWHPNGKIKARYSFIDDRLVGVVKHWHSNGNMFQEFHTSKGKVHGEFKEWFKNGEMAIQCRYKYGRRWSVFRHCYFHEIGTGPMRFWECGGVWDFRDNPRSSCILKLE